MAIKHWVRENGKGYFVGPEEEMYHETDVECEPKPSINHDWVNGVWVLNEERKASHMKELAKQEVERCKPFHFIVMDDVLEERERKDYLSMVSKVAIGMSDKMPRKPRFME